MFDGIIGDSIKEHESKGDKMFYELGFKKTTRPYREVFTREDGSVRMIISFPVHGSFYTARSFVDGVQGDVFIGRKLHEAISIKVEELLGGGQSE